MDSTTAPLLASDFAGLDPRDPQYAVEAIDRILAAGRRLVASDLHLQPTADGLDLRLRIDGVLQPRHSSSHRA